MSQKLSAYQRNHFIVQCDELVERERVLQLADGLLQVAGEVEPEDLLALAG